MMVTKPWSTTRSADLGFSSGSILRPPAAETAFAPWDPTAINLIMQPTRWMPIAKRQSRLTPTSRLPMKECYMAELRVMGQDRIAAFSDGVIAIIITIMVLELKVPHGADWKVLLGVAPSFVSYVLSFIYLAIYWNNHHHLLHTLTRVDGLILWTNSYLLFWLSLIPAATAWMGENFL